MDYITVTRYDSRDNLYVAYHPDLPGCVADGATGDEARANLALFRETWLAHYREHGLAIPQPRALGDVWQDANAHLWSDV